MSKRNAALHQCLEEIRLQNAKGLLLPAAVVEAARPVDHPLHRRFEWDETKAAQEYRLWQARELITTCWVKIEANKKPPIVCQCWVSLGNDRKSGGGYRNVVDVMADPTKRRALIREALAEHDRWEAKYEMLRDDLAPLFQARRKLRLKYN